MTIEFFALTFDFIGKVLLGITALLVHRRIKREQKIDKQVLKEMKFEQAIGIIAILLIFIGYLLHLIVL